MNRVYISPAAKSDLEEIKQYISDELYNPQAALRIISDITRRIRLLQEFPETGAPLSSIVEIETPYRFLVCGKYLTFYRFEKDTVFVDRILYGRRDYLKILFSDTSDETDD
ncbi:type II toxin-antitoxin system RelE/ParE family toxin [Brucepastera parasyntrophica]|uniref:type II toxin-antitoxin system RelE/ParE family toxin n=1 Tax=Brucepastera parasyntrophica TaxID=2880008 RepID=UPI00210EC9B5|nr:type II toxin-antitoxin system RelE/ParE family toxin [Brucepastera parasyntrophica]ULQ60416.1 type II toxin-antitoxin system RelE/ParE family toxin [Brucepastera parasyntrophica]